MGVTGALSSGDVTVRVSGDAEGGTPTSFAGEALGQSQIEGRADRPADPRGASGGRAPTPYLTVSAGALRQWHEGNVHVETGHVVQGGAGLRYGCLTRPRAEGPHGSAGGRRPRSA